MISSADLQSPIVLDSVTKLGSDARGRVAYCASHAGLYAVYLAAKAQVSAVILSDAGVGIDQAGIAGLDLLDSCGIPGATTGHRTSRIGDGADGLQRGRLTYVNRGAERLGLEPDMPCTVALFLLCKKISWSGSKQPTLSESRTQLEVGSDPRIRVYAIDSNALVQAEDRGMIVVTGSHGGILGGKPASAIKVDVYAAVYNDADRGIDDAGVSRLPALDTRGIAAACVSAWTARIGDGMSTYRDGIISAINETAKLRGARIGTRAKQFVEVMVRQRLKEIE
jgi:hypothetical protein